MILSARNFAMNLSKAFSFRRRAGGIVNLLGVTWDALSPSQVVLTFDKDITALGSSWDGLQCKLAADPDWLPNAGLAITASNQITMQLPFDGTGVNFEVEIFTALPSEIRWGENTLANVPIYTLIQNGGAKPPP
jgi:hypothetical protein